MSIWKQVLLILVLAGLGVGGYEGYRRYVAPAETAAAAQSGPGEVTVEVARARTVTMRETVEAVGTTRASQSVEIVPLASGRIVELAIRPGQKVEKGQVLARLDNEIEEADLAEAQALLVEQRQQVERVERLQRTNAVSLATLEQATAQFAAAEAAVERARRRLADRTIRAPFEGVVGLTDADLGARVDDETVLTRLDDLSQIEVEFSLPETLFAEIAIGQPVAARSAAFRDRSFTGRVISIDTRIDPVSRAFKVRAVIPNPDDLLPAGMFMSLTLTLAEEAKLVVPEEAIVVQAADTFVFLVEAGRASRRSVITGQRREGVVAVEKGLEEGAAVVTKGLQRVRDGSAVRILGGSEGTASAARAGSGS